MPPLPEKTEELVDALIEKTRTKSLKWEPTAADKTFACTFGGRASFAVVEIPDQFDGVDHSLTMTDSDGREIFRLDTRQFGGTLAVKLAELYFLARDLALNIGGRIDSILEELKKK